MLMLHQQESLMSAATPSKPPSIFTNWRNLDGMPQENRIVQFSDLNEMSKG